MKNAKIDNFSGKHDLSSCRSCIRGHNSGLKEIFTAPQLLSYSMYPKTSLVNFVNTESGSSTETYGISYKNSRLEKSRTHIHSFHGPFNRKFSYSICNDRPQQCFRSALVSIRIQVSNVSQCGSRFCHHLESKMCTAKYLNFIFFQFSIFFAL